MQLPKWLFFFWLLILGWQNLGLAQQDLFVFEKGRRRVDIPFTYENNFILVKIKLNRFIPLNFIFDTGAEYTILAKREFTDLLGIEYEREFKLIGADLKTVLTAYLAKKIDISLPGVRAEDQNILVLDKNYFEFEEYAGVQVDGILGADVFKNFVVKIDYRRRVISLFSPASFEPPKGYDAYSIDITANKAYLNAEVQINDSLTIPSRLLIDSGAGISLLLYTNVHKEFKMPENVIPGNIGMGLGGFMEGYMGRIKQFNMGDFNFKNIITNFQKLSVDGDSMLMKTRDGILGNKILERFTVYIDYHRSRLYLKPKKNYNRGFKHDRSGLILIASNNDFDKISINNVVVGSPADQVGLKKGDIIKNVNRIPITFLGLSGVTKKLQKKIGKKIRIAVIRDGEKQIFIFRLRDLI